MICRHGCNQQLAHDCHLGHLARYCPDLDLRLHSYLISCGFICWLRERKWWWPSPPAATRRVCPAPGGFGRWNPWNPASLRLYASRSPLPRPSIKLIQLISDSLSFYGHTVWYYNYNHVRVVVTYSNNLVCKEPLLRLPMTCCVRKLKWDPREAAPARRAQNLWGP